MFVKNFTDGTLTPEQLKNSRIVFYLGALAVYNIMTQAIRQPNTLPLLTAAMKHDMDQFLASSEGPLPAKLGDVKFH